MFLRATSARAAVVGDGTESTSRYHPRASVPMPFVMPSKCSHSPSVSRTKCWVARVYRIQGIFGSEAAPGLR
jgi:hypothetical protein